MKERPELCPEVMRLEGAEKVACRQGEVFALAGGFRVCRCNQWGQTCQFR